MSLESEEGILVSVVLAYCVMEVPWLQFLASVMFLNAASLAQSKCGYIVFTCAIILNLQVHAIHAYWESVAKPCPLTLIHSVC